MTVLTSNIMKVGAHLDDTRALVEVWAPELDAETNIRRIVDDNLLGLPSQSRAHDVMTRALRPRFIDPDSGILAALAVLSRDADVFRDACYYELTRVDGLVAAFAEEQLAEWWDEGRTAIDTGDARRWIDDLAAHERVPDWAPNIRDRVARGMLASLRDLGRLIGARSSSRKEIARPGITVPGFAYASFRLHQQGQSGRGVLTSRAWRRWLVDPSRADELMHAIASLGVVYYSVAGSTLRVDWRFDDLVGVARATI